MKTLIRENLFENVNCKMAVILLWINVHLKLYIYRYVTKGIFAIRYVQWNEVEVVPRQGLTLIFQTTWQVGQLYATIYFKFDILTWQKSGIYILIV